LIRQFYDRIEKPLSLESDRGFFSDEVENMEIRKLDYDFTVCKVTDYSGVDLNADYFFIEKTEDENSLVCLTRDVPQNVTEREDLFLHYLPLIRIISW